MDDCAVLYQPGPVARVIMNRPQRKNAQSAQMLLELEQAFEAANRAPNVRVIVLSGAGGHFSSGHDLGSAEHLQAWKSHSDGLDDFGRDTQRNDLYLESHLRLRSIEKPTVAMVQGYCVFGGWAIAAAMDCIFASEDALLIPIYGGYATTPWDIGVRKAKELLFENRFMRAAEALQWGFVNRVYAEGTLEQRTLQYASRVAENEPRFLHDIKFGINQTQDMMGFTTSARTMSRMFFSQDERAPSDEARLDSSRSIVRNRVQRALEYLAEDEPEAWSRARQSR